MANQEQLDILKQGSEVWNAWREEYDQVEIDPRYDLEGADLRETDLRRANLTHAFLTEADLSGADLRGAYLGRALLLRAKLRRADMMGAHLIEANFTLADLSGAILNNTTSRFSRFLMANLRGADLTESDFRGADFRDADLTGTDLTSTILVKVDFENANLTGCRVHGTSVWDVDLKNTIQSNIIITHYDDPTITVDNIEIAQFIYLLLNNKKIRDVIDTIAKKAVLILGRFTPERKAILDSLRETLRTYGYVPILFDFDKPSSQDLTETVSTLAHLSRFIIVDLTDPSSAPYEVATIASNHIRPIQALFHPSDEAKRVFAMYLDLIKRYHWVLPPYEYQDQEQLFASLQTKVIIPAELKAQELEKR